MGQRLLGRLERDPLLAISLGISLMIPPGFVILQLVSPLGWFDCPLKSWTGVPCFSCGITRMVVHLAQGDLAAAFIVQPLGFLLVFGIPLYLPYGLTCSDRGGVSPSMGRLRFATAVGLSLGLLNWVYLVVAGV